VTGSRARRNHPKPAAALRESARRWPCKGSVVSLHRITTHLKQCHFKTQQPYGTIGAPNAGGQPSTAGDGPCIAKRRVQTSLHKKNLISHGNPWYVRCGPPGSARDRPPTTSPRRTTHLLHALWSAPVPYCHTPPGPQSSPHESLNKCQGRWQTARFGCRYCNAQHRQCWPAGALTSVCWRCTRRLSSRWPGMPCRS
jgi:hypothetical protein